VLDEIDVLEALVRSGLPDGRPGTAALLCDEACLLAAIVVCAGRGPSDVLTLLAERIVEAAGSPGVGWNLSSVWFVILRADGECLETDAAERTDLGAAAAALAPVGIECGSPVVVGPHGWGPA
jgi:hypothetical protein